MKNPNPKPDDGSRPSDSFRIFQQTMKRLLAVSKQELDDLRAKQRAEKNSGEDRPG